MLTIVTLSEVARYSIVKMGLRKVICNRCVAEHHVRAPALRVRHVQRLQSRAERVDARAHACAVLELHRRNRRAVRQGAEVASVDVRCRHVAWRARFVPTIRAAGLSDNVTRPAVA
jgi:hypothetical protein